MPLSTCLWVWHGNGRWVLTSFRPRQNRSKTRFMLPPFSMEMMRVWSSSLIQIRKVFSLLCLGTGQHLAVLAASRASMHTQLPVPAQHCFAHPPSPDAHAAPGSKLPQLSTLPEHSTAVRQTARRCTQRWAGFHPHTLLWVMSAGSCALGTGKRCRGGAARCQPLLTLGQGHSSCTMQIAGGAARCEVHSGALGFGGAGAVCDMEVFSLRLL